MDTPPEPPPEEGPPANDEAPAAVRPRPIDETAVDEAPAAVRPRPVDETAVDEAPVAVRPRSVDETAPDPPPVIAAPPVAAGGPSAEGPSGGKAPPVAGPAPRKRTWPRVVAGIAVVLLGAAVAVALLAPGYVKGRVEEEARARGILIVFRDVDVGFSRLQLDGVRLSLSGVPDLEATAERIEVDLVDWQPQAVRARGLSISMFGTGVVDHLSAWKAANPKALAAPLEAESAVVDWHPAKGADAALSFGGSRVSVKADEGKIESAQAVFVGRAAGPVNVAWTTEDGGLAVQIRPQAAPLSAVKIDIVAAKDASPRERPQVKLSLARTALGPLQAALGIPKGSEGLEAEGEVTMPLPSLEQPAPIEGSIRLTVKGYVPPHPKELDGILFGNVTKVRADFTLAPDFGKAKLAQVQVEAGALALRGLGDVDREGFDAMVALTLKGTIPCTALATSAAVAHLGQEWGRLAGGLASGALRGNVSVVISVEAKASDLQNAKIDKSARLGCKVSVPGLPTIVIK